MIKQPSPAGQLGAASVPEHIERHNPSQQMPPFGQLSMPFLKSPVYSQASPSDLASAGSGMHLVDIYTFPPSEEYGAHFCPAGQSWTKVSHSIPLSASGAQMKGQPVDGVPAPSDAAVVKAVLSDDDDVIAVVRPVVGSAASLVA